MRTLKIILASSVASLCAIPAYAELNSWQQGFVGCSTSSSPFINDVLFKEAQQARPIMKIGGMQAWAVPDGRGGKQIAMTTDDGLTIYGRVVGPQGEDISGALLATVATIHADDQSASRSSSIAPPAPADQLASSTLLPTRSPTRDLSGQRSAPAGQVQQGGSSEAMPDQAHQPPPNSAPPVPKASTPTAPPVDKAPPVSNPQSGRSGVSADPAQSGSQQAQADVPASPAGAAPAPTPGAQAGIGTQTVLDVPRAANLDQLIQQAENFAMWAPMNNPKPDAPVVYMFVDPTCPHCAWSLDHLEPKIRDGSIALRMIMAPILSEEAFHIGMSIIHNANPPEALLQQAKLAIGGNGKAVERIDPALYDKRVKDGISRNVQWMRANKIPGVPFYLYRSAQKTEFAFGSLSDAQLATAVPAQTGTPSSAQPPAAQTPTGQSPAAQSPASQSPASQSGATGAIK